MQGTVHAKQPLAFHSRVGSISDGTAELELLTALPLNTPMIVHPDGRTWTLNWEQLAEMAYTAFDQDISDKKPVRHSPIKLRVLLHHYYSPANWTDEHPDSPAAGEATDYWLRAGCLEEVDNSDRDSGFQLTALGKAMVEGWLSLPLPEIQEAPCPA